ncbi:MAG: hypothetical protein M3033_13530 [Acidobacteriota bacterium]|nr:hypothetical protein [Acidobacteriota bacterium]
MTNYWLTILGGFVFIGVSILISRRIKNPFANFVLGTIIFLSSLLLLFYINFGEINWYAISFATAISTFIILAKAGLYANEKDSRYAPINCNNVGDHDWLDKITLAGIMFYVFGPFFGWFLTGATMFSHGEEDWRLQYGIRVCLSIVIPVLTAIVILVFYIKRFAFWVYLPIILIITALPVWSGLNSLLDLIYGAQTQIISHNCSFNKDTLECLCKGQVVNCSKMEKDEEISVLPYTQRVLSQKTIK